MTRRFLLRWLPGLACAGLLIAQDSAIQRRVNELHVLTFNYYVEPHTNTILERLDQGGRPIFIRGLRETPTLEDSAFMTATLLDSLVLRHKISKRAGAFEQAHSIFQGLLEIATVSPSKGLPARGVHPDGVTYWGNPSNRPWIFVSTLVGRK